MEVSYFAVVSGTVHHESCRLWCGWPIATIPTSSKSLFVSIAFSCRSKKGQTLQLDSWQASCRDSGSAQNLGQKAVGKNWLGKTWTLLLQVMSNQPAKIINFMAQKCRMTVGPRHHGFCLRAVSTVWMSSRDLCEGCFVLIVSLLKKWPLSMRENPVPMCWGSGAESLRARTGLAAVPSMDGAGLMGFPCFKERHQPTKLSGKTAATESLDGHPETWRYLEIFKNPWNSFKANETDTSPQPNINPRHYNLRRPNQKAKQVDIEAPWSSQVWHLALVLMLSVFWCFLFRTKTFQKLQDWHALVPTRYHQHHLPCTSRGLRRSKNLWLPFILSCLWHTWWANCLVKSPG